MDNKLNLAFIKVLKGIEGIDKSVIKKVKMANEIEEVNDILFRLCDDTRLRRARAIHCVLFRKACDEIINGIKLKNERDLTCDEKEILEYSKSKDFMNLLHDGCLIHDSFKFIDLWRHAELAGLVAEYAVFPDVISKAIYYHSRPDSIGEDNVILKLFCDCDYISKLYPSFINCMLNIQDEKKLENNIDKLKRKIMNMHFNFEASKTIYAEKLPLTMDIIQCREMDKDLSKEPVEYRNAIMILKEAIGDKIFELKTADYNEYNKRMIRYISQNDYHSIIMHVYAICDGDENDKANTFKNAQLYSMEIGNKIREIKEFKRLSENEIKDLENAVLLKDLFKYISHNVNFKREKLLYEFIHSLGFDYRICNSIKHLNEEKTNDILSLYIRSVIS